MRETEISLCGEIIASATSATLEIEMRRERLK